MPRWKGYLKLGESAIQVLLGQVPASRKTAADSCEIIVLQTHGTGYLLYDLC